MDYKQANDALNNGYPVIFNKIKYKWINAITWRIIRNTDGSIVEKYIHAELMDYNENAVVIARIDKITKA